MTADSIIDRMLAAFAKLGPRPVYRIVGRAETIDAFALALDWARAMGEPPEKSLPAWCGIPMVSDETVPQDEVHFRQDGRTVQVIEFKRQETT